MRKDFRPDVYSHLQVKESYFVCLFAEKSEKVMLVSVSRGEGGRSSKELVVYKTEV